MVRALLAGTKTQTRRALKVQPTGTPHAGQASLTKSMSKPVFYAMWEEPAADGSTCCLCPYGVPGDRLWVREGHSIGPGPDVQLVPGEGAGSLRWPHVTYAADGAVERRDERWKGEFGKRRPSIHMPRWASRITLEVTGVRVERLHDISERDAIAEGAPGYEEGIDAPPPDDEHEWSYLASFIRLWESINGPGSWDANPYVWVVEFKRISA